MNRQLRSTNKRQKDNISRNDRINKEEETARNIQTRVVIPAEDYLRGNLAVSEASVRRLTNEVSDLMERIEELEKDGSFLCAKPIMAERAVSLPLAPNKTNRAVSPPLAPRRIDKAISPVRRPACAGIEPASLGLKAPLDGAAGGEESGKKDPPAGAVAKVSAGAAPRRAHKLPPRTATVVVTCPGEAYADTLGEAQSKVDLAALGIDDLRVRCTLTGTFAYEIPGEGAADKADQLAAGIAAVIGERPGVKISRPVKLAKIRLAGLDVTATSATVGQAFALAGECKVEEVRVKTVRAGPAGTFSAWAKCPLVAVNRIIAAGGRIRVGLATARVTVLEERLLACFKCIEMVHIRAQCPYKANQCYRCGEPGHLAGKCSSAQVKCMVCAKKGRKSDHQPGGKACPERVGKGRGLKSLDL